MAVRETVPVTARTLHLMYWPEIRTALLVLAIVGWLVLIVVDVFTAPVIDSAVPASTRCSSVSPGEGRAACYQYEQDDAYEDE